jgi:hypothetical protein
MLAECPCMPMELRGRPRGVRAPEMELRLMGRGGGIISVLLDGRAYDEMLARELGRDIDASESPCGLRLGRGPKDSLLTPEVLGRETWRDVAPVVAGPRGLVGVVSSPPWTDEEAVEPTVRFLVRIVTVEGTLLAPWTEDLGDARGGVLTGAGSLDRADWTRASSRCIWAVRLLMWVREFEAGIRCDVPRAPGSLGAGVRVAAVAAPAAVGRVGGLDEVELPNAGRGLGVMLWSAEGRRDLRVVEGAGVFAATFLGAGVGAGTETSDMGGEGGSWSCFPARRGSVSGGVVMSGELAVESGERSAILSKVGESSMERSVDTAERWRDSCFLIFSRRTSVSILRSDSSSRRR